MRSRSGVLWSWGLGLTLALSLGACGVEPLEEKIRPLEEGVSQEDDGALTRERPEALLTWDPYADAVASGTTATVLNASAALGAPDGQAATLLGLLNAALVLDLGQGEEGTGDLRVYYQGLSLALVAQVDFLKADGTFIGSSSLHLVELGLGTHVAVATYPGNVPYRYVRLRGAVLALYLVDAVETSLRPFCGDGVSAGFETCDDGNQLSGDGCNSVCQVEPGYTCTGQPSVCDNNSAPTVEDVHATTPEDTSVNITIPATDPDGDALAFSYTTPGHGTLTLSGASVTYTPNANFAGEDAFQVTVSDGKKQATATISVTVTPVNDAPVAASAAVTVNYNTSTPITLTATDVEGDALTFTVTAPTHGTLSGTGAQVLYTPAADFQGQDQFTFEASDGALASNTATVTITVRGPPVCGDGFVDSGEVCDDGNRAAGDGCRADCQGVEVCGDGLVDSVAGEQCDDGGTTPGDGCDAACQLDAFTNVPPTLISGTLNCTTANTNTGRKVAVDALGRFYAVMRCGGAVHVSVSVDRGHTWVGPTPLGITNAAEVAIEGGPTGVAYVAATSAGTVIFTRTVDAGATWDAPRVLSSAANPTVSLDSRGDALYICVSQGSAGVRVLRNFARGANDFSVTDVEQRNAFFDVIVDKISGDVFSVSDDPSFRIRRSSDQGTTFGPLSSPPGQAFFSDWTGSNGFIYTTGSNGDNNVDVIPMSTPGTSTQVPGLPTDVGPGSFRTIDADALGNGYIATQRGTGDIQLDRMLVGAATILTTDARTVGPGAAPAVAALPSNGGALVAYTNGTSIYASVVVY
ncbi:tandem-95 repeat protein [Corallococcus praedator]|uniref:Tandem-95 repeat protein n=1 Tax=Corallococcus praedator TaxID=2316724 RepID=A0ABX9QL33_9BACT|nr:MULTISPECIES: Ig-like domain-containing protein [Corallococcus]RKH34070.1 tandem-95 repeat protein [Corallococcus sp. CA031C]RKI09603.1 tandem-95 repeat protein [Corallococcus praedator]